MCDHLISYWVNGVYLVILLMEGHHTLLSFMVVWRAHTQLCRFRARYQLCRFRACTQLCRFCAHTQLCRFRAPTQP